MPPARERSVKDIVTFRIDPEDKEKVEQLAGNEDRTVSQVLSIIVKTYLQKHGADRLVRI